MVNNNHKRHYSRSYVTPKLAKAVERHFDHVKEKHNGQRHKDEVDPLPWPHELGLHILNPATKTPRFWPWPNKDWTFNKKALDAISIVNYMQSLLEKPGELWTDGDNEFYQAIHAEPEVKPNERDNITLQSSHSNPRTATG